MREIKFRAWDGEQMFHDVQKAYDWQQGQRYELQQRGRIKTALCFDSFEDVIIGAQKEGCALMQYTGLKDGKRTKEFPEGQEIYEGDIVTRPIEMIDADDLTFEYIIVWRGAGFCAKANIPPTIYRDDFESWFDMEVLGNIHENPELVE